eukprot:1541560-Alexandrium_andersonii.AAC.1
MPKASVRVWPWGRPPASTLFGPLGAKGIGEAGASSVGSSTLVAAVALCLLASGPDPAQRRNSGGP